MCEKWRAFAYLTCESRHRHASGREVAVPPTYLLRTTGPAYNDAGGFRAHAAVLGFWVMVERKTFGTRQSLAVWHCGHWRGAGRPAGAVTSTERAKAEAQRGLINYLRTTGPA